LTIHASKRKKIRTTLEEISMDIYMHDAAKKGDEVELKWLMSQGANVNAKDNEGRTPIHYAAREGHYKAMDLLIKQNANVNAQDHNNMTPMHYAVGNNHSAAMELLKKYDANVDAKDINGMTPMHYATENGHFNTMQLLKKLGANVRANDDKGRTPMHVAAIKSGQKKVIRWLKEQGADINARDDEDKTPMHYVARKGIQATMEVLKEQGADINARDDEGKTPRDYAAKRKNKDMEEWLKSQGAEQGYFKAMKLLKKQDANVNARDNDGHTPTNDAAKNRKDLTLKAIFQRPSFVANLGSLKTHHAINYDKIRRILVELKDGVEPSSQRRTESRIPNCITYELSDGYRAVFQQVKDTEGMLALCVGSPVQVDFFLDNHKGWIFDPKTGRIKEIRLAAIDDVAVNAAPSVALQDATSEQKGGEIEAEVTNAPPLFHEFTDKMLANLDIPTDFFARLRDIHDSSSISLFPMLDEMQSVSSHASTLLLAFATGDSEGREAILGVARKERDYKPILQSADQQIMRQNPDEFLTFEDPKEIEEMLEAGRFEQWQLFLAPEQKPLVTRLFDGSARIRGISGSGKTVVALHRARQVAKRHACAHQEFEKRILFTTFNKALARAASKLLDSLCGPERSLIEVTHLHKWCLDFIQFRLGKKPQWSPEASDDSLMEHETAFRLYCEYQWNRRR